MKNLINTNLFYASNVLDETNENGIVTYKMSIPTTDEYFISCDKAKEITIYDENEEIINSAQKEMTIRLNEKDVIYILIVTNDPKEEFFLRFYPINNQIAVPYEINIENDGKDVPLFNDESDPLTHSLIKMKKRNGGTYLYSNVPESMPDEVVNSIIMQNNDLQGDCFLTYEHQNASSIEDIYMGYRIVNNNDHDIYVTVRNVGLQVNGSWLGEKSWMDYYGVKYEMDKTHFYKEPFDYFGKQYDAHKWFNDYLHFDVDYIPNNISPTTYKIPPKQYIYVIGGTSVDSYKNVNVNNTANQIIKPHNCANGNVFFTINNGKATGELCVYDEPSKINTPNVIVQNMRRYGEKDDFGGRLGVSNHHGVIDVNPMWVFNDLTPSQNLPVVYYPYYADVLKEKYEPYEKVEGSYEHEYKSDRWFSHLSAQYHHNYVGEDMVENTVLCDGKEVVLSVNIANPAGNVWDFGNWMIEYHENCVFVNQGNKERIVKVHLVNAGSIFYIIKDEHGNILKPGATLITCEGRRPAYECIIPAHSKVILSVQFVLPANNNGSVEHYIELI